MRPRQLPLKFPLMGVNLTAPYGELPVRQTAGLKNVMPFDAEDVLRGSKRPGTARAIADALPGPVQRMRQVTLSAGGFIDPGSFFTDPVYGAGSGGSGNGFGGGFLRPQPPYYTGNDWPVDDNDTPPDPEYVDAWDIAAYGFMAEYGYTFGACITGGIEDLQYVGSTDAVSLLGGDAPTTISPVDPVPVYYTNATPDATVVVRTAQSPGCSGSVVSTIGGSGTRVTFAYVDYDLVAPGVLPGLRLALTVQIGYDVPSESGVITYDIGVDPNTFQPYKRDDFAYDTPVAIPITASPSPQAFLVLTRRRKLV